MTLVAQHPRQLPDRYPAHLEDELWLPAGDRLWIRPIVPLDAAVLAAEFAMADDDTVYMRFFNPSFELTEDRLRYLTEIDYVNHLALAAMTVGGDQSTGIAIARYVARSETDVEGAIVVKPEYRRAGVASLLFGRLAAVARDHGFKTMSASHLAHNAGAARLLAGLGFEETGRDDGVVEVVLYLDELRPELSL